MILNLKKYVIFFLIACFKILAYVNGSQDQSNYCSPPWERVNDDLCILFNSGAKSWLHAKYMCNFNNSSLLYIQNQSEQEQLMEFLKPLLRYRFTQRPYIWLDAVSDKLADENTIWKWSNINQKINFTNWADKMDDSVNARCGCLKAKDGIWRNCECLSVQHFICRKTNPASNVLIINQALSVDSSRDSSISNKIDESGDKINNLQRNVEANNLESEHSPTIKLENTQKKDFLNRVPFVNILRMKIRKSSFQFRTYECPLGFGFYSIDEDKHCTRYKICENWDNIYSFLVINKCVDGTIFNFKEQRCVDSSSYKCNPNFSFFSPI